MSLPTFLQAHSNSKEGSYIYWQNRYSNLKTTFHIELNFFLWTESLESLLLWKYLISVAATLSKDFKCFLLELFELYSCCTLKNCYKWLNFNLHHSLINKGISELSESIWKIWTKLKKNRYPSLTIVNNGHHISYSAHSICFFG